MDDEHNTPVRIIIKKKRGHGGAHGGAWKVAYADFVTAMMALFIVLWIVGQSSAVKKAVAGYFKDPGVFSTTSSGGLLEGSAKTSPITPPVAKPGDPVKEMQMLNNEAMKIKEMISSTQEFAKFAKEVVITVTKEGMRIDLLEQREGLFFDIGKATIKPETEHLLVLIAKRVAPLPNSVAIEGYTDARPYTSSDYSNWDLSTDRANAARRVLEKSLKKDQIAEVRGFADRKLRVPEKPLDSSNRRVSILVKSSQPNEEVKVPVPSVGLKAMMPPNPVTGVPREKGK